MTRSNYAVRYMQRAAMRAKPEELGTCSACDAPVMDGDGWTNHVPGGYRHQSCIQAAETRGMRIGYQETLKMLREAEKALKASKA